MGVNYAPALLFSFSSLLLLGIVIHYSWELSRLESRTRRLGEEIALLNERLNDAERPTMGRMNRDLLDHRAGSGRCCLRSPGSR